MNFPQGLIDFLVYLAPSLMVFFTTWFLVRRFLQRETTLKMLEHVQEVFLKLQVIL